MNTERRWVRGGLLLAVLLGISHIPCAAQGTFDLRSALDRYFGALADGFGLIAPDALNEQIQTSPPLLVDVREVAEIAAAGFVPVSISIPLGSLMRNLDKLPARERSIVLTCGSGHRSALAMEALQLLGYTQVKSLAGGFRAWKAAGLPVASGTPGSAKSSTAPEVDPHLAGILDSYFRGLPQGWNTIAPSALKELIAVSKPFQLDVREPNEIAESSSIAGSVDIPIRALIRNLHRLPPDKGALIVTECRSGHRGALAMMALSLLGYSNVRSLAGGIAAWK